MRSKTSCFNKTLYKMDLKGQFIAVVILLVLYLLIFILPGVYNPGSNSEMMTVGSLMLLTNPIVIGILSVCFVLFSLGYMYKKRSSFMMHAFPTTRAEAFISHSLSGLTSIMIMAVFCYICVFLINTSSLRTPIIWMSVLETFVEILFFYSMALFVAVVCGNGILFVVTYGVLNALWFFICSFIGLLNSLLLTHPIARDYGSHVGSDFLSFRGASPLFPAYFFFAREPDMYDAFMGLNSAPKGYFYDILWMFIPTVVFFILAFILFKKRRVEKTGEMVAFGWCKAVFRVMFTLCSAALVAGVCIVPVVFGGLSSGLENTAATSILILALVIGGAIGYLVSEMLLNKTVKIFSKEKLSILQGAVPLALLIVYVVLVSTNVIGPKLVPDYDEVASIQISGDDISSMLVFDKKTSPDIVRAIIDTNKKLVNDRELMDLAKKYDDNLRNIAFDVVYENESGSRGCMLEYSYTDAQKQELFAPLMNTLTKGDHLKEALFGEYKWRPVDIRFTEFGSGDGKYSWDAQAFNLHLKNGESLIIRDDEYVMIQGTGDSPTMLTKYDYLNSDDPAIWNKDDDVLGMQLAYANDTDLFNAIKADMEAGQIIPLSKDAAMRLYGESVTDKIYCQITLELKCDKTYTIDDYSMTSEDEKYIDVCLTSDSLNTINYLTECKAMHKM